jgi:ribonuclease R
MNENELTVTEVQKMVLGHVNRENYKPVKPKVIAKKLGLLDQEDGFRLVKKAIKRLIKDGNVKWGAKHLIEKVKKDSKPKSRKRKPDSPSKSEGGSKRSKKPRKNEVVGKFSRAAGGYGFVRPSNTTVSDRSEDIYVPHRKTLDATNGDIVRIITSKSQRGDRVRVTGRVIDIVERATNQFVGTYREQDELGFVVVDNSIFDTGILVGDAGAKNCRSGDKVVIEMVRFPSHHSEGEGVIVKVLGERGEPGVDTQTIIHEFDLPGEFPEDALESARAQAEKFDESIPKGRTDFTQDTVVTIDPKEARDFDDAISLKRLENGHWQLGVHIADVSHFVPMRSKLDDEAYRRATSVYLPDKVIPMLPEIISNNLASLQPDRVRYTMTAVIEFDEEGVPIATDLHRGAIKSAHRFNYEEVDEYLADDRPWKKTLTPEVFQIVRNMHTLAMMLRKRRMTRGAIDLAIPEVKIELDEDGKVSGATTRKNTESHQMIEEFMLAANEAVAQKLEDMGYFLIRRIHEPPSEKKLGELTNFVREMGIDCDSMQSRFEIKRVAELANARPDRAAVHFSILRAMQKAVYSPKEIGHYALNSKAYCHFTSPIRRYPDLIIHRMVGDVIDGKKPMSDFDRLTKLGQHCSGLEQRAEQAERELKKLKLMNYLSDKIDLEMEAVVTGVEPYGLFAQGIELPAEGLIPLTNLPPDEYLFDRAARTLNGYRETNQFRLGDRVLIRVSHVDPDRREMEFELIRVVASHKPPKLKSKSKSGGKPKNKSKKHGKGNRKNRRK